MFRRSLIIALLLAFASMPNFDVRAQKLHALVVGDTSDWARWGKFLPNVQMDLLYAFVMFHNNVPANQLDMLNITLETDFGETPTGILKIIDEFNVDPNDTLVFYYTGHGGSNDRGHYLAMEKGNIYRSELKRRMQAKRARMTVIVTDCCNVRSDGQAFAAPAPRLESPRNVTPIFDSLFFKPRGIVDVNSSAPNESAFFFAEKDEFGLAQGSLFSRTFTRFIERERDRHISWDTLVHNVSLGVHVAFKKNYPNGASVAKGASHQLQQNVYPVAYPGMPDKKGPRTGLMVRNHGASGALVVRVVPDSPGSRVYSVRKGRYGSLPTNVVIYSANGRQVKNADDFVAIVKDSPQIMRLSVGRSLRQQSEILMRLRY